MSATGLFAGVDRSLFAASFARRLRAAGLDPTVTSVERCAAALGTVDAPSIGDLYWLCRLSFVARHRDLDRFDDVFRAVFDAEPGRIPTRQRGQARSRGATDDRLAAVRRPANGPSILAPALPWATRPSLAAAVPDDGKEEPIDQQVVHERRPTALGVDADRPFDALDEAELERVGALLESALVDWPERRSRRRRTTRSKGRVELRRSVRRAMHTGGDVFRLLHSEPRRRPRKVVVLLDVSGSMESYARAYLHLTRVLAVTHHAEVFAFATRLSRITPSVRLRRPAEAIEHVSTTVGDRFSGTRVATSVRELLHHRVWSTTVRGAVVVICSDGWDADDPVDLDRAMRRLALLTHRIVWVNPRAAADGFEPTTGGMAAALPHCDHFLAGNTARSMDEVVAAITAA